MPSLAGRAIHWLRITDPCTCFFVPLDFVTKTAGDRSRGWSNRESQCAFELVSIVGFVLLETLALSCRGAIVNVSTQIDANKLLLTSIELSQAGQSNRVIAFSQLITPTLTDYRSVPESNAANTITVFGTPDAVAPSGGDRLALISDAALNTGIFNPSTTGPGITLAFDPPLINGPGNDIVVFELTIGTTQTPDPFSLYQGSGTGLTRNIGSSSYGIHGLIPTECAPATWLATVANGASAGLSELLGPATSAGVTSVPQWWAVGVDISSLGVPDWGQVESIVLISQDATRAIDPLTIVGLPPITVAGDYNLDGVVNDADYLEWRSQFGSTISRLGSGADGNADGVVDAADYVVWRKTLSTGFASLIVPEPASLVTIGLALCVALSIRNRGGGLRH